MKNIVDINDRINKLPANLLFTKEKLLDMQQKENAALTICAAQLGNNYLMLEIIDWYITNCYSKLKEQPWFKNEIKKNIKTAHSKIQAEINASRFSSQSSSEYLMEMADSMYEILKLDLLKFKNSVMLKLSNIKYDTSAIADIVLVDTLLQWNTMYYDRTINKMKRFYSNPDYNSWFYQCRCTVAQNLWSKALSIFSKQYVTDTIDLNESNLILNALMVIDNKMNSNELAEKLRIEHSDIEDNGEDVMNEALAVFNEEPITPVEEVIAKQEQVIEVTQPQDIAEILSQKYKVTKK